MRNYTTIEQSNRLLEIGFDPDTADMLYLKQIPCGAFFSRPAVKGEDTEEYYADSVPCWSVGALADVLYKRLYDIDVIYDEASGRYWASYGEVGQSYNTDDYETIIDALFELACWLFKYKSI